MNTPNDSFEEELRALRPGVPSARLAVRIAAALDGADAQARVARQARRPSPALWLSWGVAAAMTVAFFSRTPTAPAAAGPAAVDRPAPSSSAGSTAAQGASPRFTPVATTNTLVGALDEGVVFLEDGRPARKVRYEFLDTVDLRSTDDSRATIVVTTPREEIRLVPVPTL